MRDDQPNSFSPPLSPALGDFMEILRDADALLALMGREPLAVVGSLASELTARANDAGEVEIANAASAVGRMASAREGAALVGAMQRLASAMIHAQAVHHVDAA